MDTVELQDQPARLPPPAGFVLGPPPVSGTYHTVRANIFGKWLENQIITVPWTVRNGLAWYRHNEEDPRAATIPEEDGWTSRTMTLEHAHVAHMPDQMHAKTVALLDSMTVEEIEAYLEQRRAGR